MKRIGIICAMAEELEELSKLLTLEQKHTYYDIEVLECNLGGKKLFLAESGVGKVNAARCAQIMIDHLDLDCIFNIGVAGSVSKEVKVCDVVIGKKLVQHDFDVTPFDHELGYVPKVGVYVESDKRLVEIADKAMDNSHKGIIASGDVFCTKKEMSEHIAKTFNALCVEMEGASIAQVCFLSKVPFLVIRSISDSPDGSENKLTFEEFLFESAQKVAKELIEIIKQI
ncbi:MAG: 5'-methylthioadenosine/adenosylhomocysteine nucleosidase [Bacilli bacterium]|nr:5'-methylthioadenosine/adenosylhomocysteine nucleosidase [Bacilli bacterium]